MLTQKTESCRTYHDHYWNLTSIPQTVYSTFWFHWHLSPEFDISVLASPFWRFPRSAQHRIELFPILSLYLLGHWHTSFQTPLKTLHLSPNDVCIYLRKLLSDNQFCRAFLSSKTLNVGISTIWSRKKTGWKLHIICLPTRLEQPLTQKTTRHEFKFVTISLLLHCNQDVFYLWGKQMVDWHDQA